MEETRTDLQRGPGVIALWAGVLVGPIAALTQLETNYALVLWACYAKKYWPLHLVSLLALVLTIIAGVFAYLHWSPMREQAREDAGGVVPRSAFMAAVGVLISGLMVLVIIAQWLAIFTYDACQR